MMKKFMGFVATVLLFATISVVAPACATLSAVLPDVIAAVVDGGQILDTIEGFVANYFATHPDAAAEKKVSEALARARLALNVALRTAQGAKNVDDRQVDAAFENFKAAYLDLLALVKPFGVSSSPNAALKAAPGHLDVPEPLAFRPRSHR